MRRLAWAASAAVACIGLGCQTSRSPVADASPALVPSSAGTPYRMQKPDGPQTPPAKAATILPPVPHQGDVKRTVFEAVPTSFPTPANAEESVRVRAHVNGVPILQDEIQQLVYPSLMKLAPQISDADRKTQQDRIYQDGISQIIDRELLLQDMEARVTRNNSSKQYLVRLQEAASKDFDKVLRQMRQQTGVKTDDEFKAILRQQGQSLEGVRRQFERNFMAREWAKGMVFQRIERWTTHQEIVDYYREHPADFQQQDTVKWNDIFIDAAQYRSREEARAVAEQIANRAKSGEPFAQLLKYDNGDASYRNGEGLGAHRGEIKPVEAEPILFAMNDGDVRVLELGNGYHVVMLVKRQRAGLIPFDDKTQDLIRKKLQMKIAEKEMKRYVDDLKQKALIEIEPMGS